MENWFEGMETYQPEKIKDGFEIIKGTFNARFNFFRFESYDGDIPELQGTEVVRYELAICDEGENMGRRLWKRFFLGSQKPDGKGKLDIHKLADTLYTLGYTFKSRDELEVCLSQAVEMTVLIRCWGWTPKDENGQDKEPIQQHIIKGQGAIVTFKTTGGIPF